MNTSREFIWCPDCREENAPYRGRCWVCDASLEGVIPETREARLVSGASAARPHFLGAQIFLTIAVLLVILGTMILVPGLGILLACVLCVPFLRTAIVSKRRVERGHDDAFPTTVSLFLGSLAVTFVILTVVGVTAFGTFCVVCFGTFVATENVGLAVWVSGGCGVLVLVPLCRRFWKWVKRRWKRDIGETQE